MTATPLPPLPEAYDIDDQERRFWHEQILARDAQWQAYTTQARADLETQLKQWGNVFGHLGTADECGNEWIRLQDENQRLREVLRIAVTLNEHGILMVGDDLSTARHVLEKQA